MKEHILIISIYTFVRATASMLEMENNSFKCFYVLPEEGEIREILQSSTFKFSFSFSKYNSCE